MLFARWLFRIAGLYGLAVLLPHISVRNGRAMTIGKCLARARRVEVYSVSSPPSRGPRVDRIRRKPTLQRLHV